MRNAILALVVGLGFSAAARAADPIVVHEWGTFTSLQDEQGRAVGRINTDDEPVPAFVHQIGALALFPPTLAYDSDAKGVPEGDPNVTMRLETPVLYFHLPKDRREPVKLNVHIEFKGGWLTQYYPDATAIFDKLRPDQAALLSASSVGVLDWRGLAVNGLDGTMPATQDHVWTAPRDVASEPIVAGGEREQFIFYRGVGHLNAPMSVMRHDDVLDIRSAAEGVTVNRSWLVDIRADGWVAFRVVGKVTPELGASTAAGFAQSDYSRQNLTSLRDTLSKALLDNGIYADEAAALLNTWERSYFQNPGQRLFFVAPQSWTDAVLPLSLSTPAQVTRVMVGRIELVTPDQRALLARLSNVPAADLKQLKEVTSAMTKLRKDPTKAALYGALAGGHGNLADLGVAVPPAYADFLALGRFRTALVFDTKSETMSALAHVLTP